MFGFVGADLSGAVMRGVEVSGVDIDAPWLSNGEHVILEEEWEHHRYAVRDLDAIEARSA